MDEARWRRVVELFTTALERAPDERSELLSAPDVDAELRREVESMLAAHSAKGVVDRLEPEMERLRHDALADATRGGATEEPGVRSEPLEPGRRVGRYEILSPLGAGGMGEVYRALDPRLQREVAIKIVGRRARQGRKALEQLEQEARAASALNHPNICTIHDIGEESASPYIVMELIAGRSLRELLSGPLPVATLLDLGRQIAGGLAAAHERGIVHRDLKPENVMVTPKGVAKILDFGLARLRHEDALVEDLGLSSEALAQSALHGTPGYLSPELIRAAPVDARSDQFSLGAILYEMAAGRRAFGGATAMESLDATLERHPASLRELRADLPPAFVAAVERCLAKDPGFRYASTRELVSELDAIAGSRTSVGAARPSRWRGLAVAAVALAAIGGLGLWSVRRDGRGLSPRRLIPLTHGEGDDSHPTFAPDGRRVIFASLRDGNQDLWMAELDGSAPVPLARTPETEDQPALSPDGSRLAFIRMHPSRNSDLFVMSIPSGEPRRIAEGALDPAWSPDGRFIAFSEYVGGWTRIARLAAAAGGAREGVTDPEPGHFHRKPAWTPDGRSIVFNNSPGGYIGRIMQVPSSGGVPRTLTADPEGTANLSAIVTPDGRYVVHVSDRGGALNLWRIPLAGGAPERITSGPGRDLDPCVSRDGSRIAFVSSPQVFRMLQVSIETGEVRSLARFEGSDVWSPDVSYDGAQIAFVQKVPGRPWRMMLMPAAGGPARTVVDGLPDVIWVRFLPDGTTLVFAARGPRGNRIGTVGTDGSGLSWRTPEGEDATYPAVSSTGGLLAYVRNESSRAAVVVQPLAGGPALHVIEGATLPRFSPDGRSVAVAGSRSYTLGVGVFDMARGEKRWLSPTGSFPVWMPDGHTLAFADAEPAGDQAAWAVDVGGGPARRLGRFKWQGKFWPFVTSRDGKSLFTTDGSDLKSTVWLAEF